ncbi:MAG: Fic family protein [Parcubacteria group bacterium]
MTPKQGIIPNTATQLRHTWFEKLGGIETVSVRNKEWLALLEEDTRNSLMIEGYFVSRAEIKDILGDPKYTQTGYKVLGYFDAALANYELAFQQYKTKQFSVSKAIIRQMHSMMFRGDPYFSWSPGEWRKGDIEITGAKVKTSHPHEIEKHIEKLIKIINASTNNLIRKIAVIHDMFEQIHPFPDGNGRVGRILINFILVGHGFPNIAFKGSEKDKKIYIGALEEADLIVSEMLYSGKKISPFIKPLVQLENLISKSLAISMDVVICNRYNEKVEKLMTLKEVSKVTNRSLPSLRVSCAQKKHICSKIGGKVKTHPNFFGSPKF